MLLQEQPFQVLVLLRHSGEIGFREELRNSLWPADTFVEFEHGVNSAIKKGLCPCRSSRFITDAGAIHGIGKTRRSVAATGFHTVEEFSCRANRRGDGGTLFLMNNWVETTPTPKPSNAAVVNAYPFLLARARECEKERHHIPNIVAVDFYRTGDVVRVVDALNGVAGRPEPSS